MVRTVSSGTGSPTLPRTTITKIAAGPVPVGATLRTADYAFLINDSRARAVVASDAVVPLIVAARAECPWLSTVVAVGTPRRRALPYERVLERASPHLEAADTS